MKFSKTSLPLALLAGSLLVVPSADAAVNLAGVTAVWRADSDQTADTIGGNAAWNAYVRSEGTFINAGDGDDLRLNESLEVGEYSYDIFLHHQSWVDDSVDLDFRGVHLNLFFDGVDAPGISARLTGGNFGALAPLSSVDVPNDADGSLVPAAGTLLYKGDGLWVTLSEMSFAVGPDEVDAYSEFPTGKEADSVISIRLSVAIPEPSTGLFALAGAGFLLARRRRG